MSGAVAVLVAALGVVLGTSLLKNAEFSSKVKNLIALVLSGVATVVVVWFTGGVDAAAAVKDPAAFAGLVGLIYGVSQLLYNFILTGTGLETALTKVRVLPGGDDSPGA